MLICILHAKNAYDTWVLAGARSRESSALPAVLRVQKSIDSGQSYLRLRIGSFSIEFLKKSIDSGQSYLRLGIGVNVCGAVLQLLNFLKDAIKKFNDFGLQERLGQDGSVP